jgi:hypothetical protein
LSRRVVEAKGKIMKINQILMVGLSLLVSSPGFATVEQCRSIGPDKERLACFDKEASPVHGSKQQTNATTEPVESTFADPVESLKAENDKVGARLKGICRGC